MSKPKKKTSDILLSLLRENDIHGCLVLMRENDDGDLLIHHAEDNCYEINIIESLALLILNKEKTSDSDWSKLIKNSAKNIITVCKIIKDIAEKHD